MILVATQIFGLGAAPEVINVADALRKDLLLVTIRPTYPDAREFRPIPGSIYASHPVMGKGVFDLSFDFETGRLRGINILKTTGNSRLDGRAIAALKMWKAKPRSVHTLHVPVDFRGWN